MQHGSRADEVQRLKLVDIDVKILAQNLNLELLVELQLHEVIQLCEEAKELHQPRVRRLENLRLRSMNKNLAGERDRNEQSLGVIGFKEEILE
jgi:sigma54-dependent transcription regulator